MYGNNEELSAMTKGNFIFAFPKLEDYKRGDDLYIGVATDWLANVLNRWIWFANVLNMLPKPKLI